MDKQSLDPALRGIPSWITPELIVDTVRTWQRYYTEPLTVQDAVGILMGVGNLFASLSGVSSHETLRRIGAGQQSGTGT